MESPYLAALRKRIEAARQLQMDMAKYGEWLDGESKDHQVNFRISKSDLVKLKAMAKARNMKYQTYLREIIQKEIRSDADGTRPIRASRVREPY